MVQIAFILVALVGAGYFGLRRRAFDYFSLAFFSSIVYFMPGFTGVTSLSAAGEWTDSPIHAETYAIMMAVMISVIISALVADLAPTRRVWRVEFQGQGIAIWLVGAAALIGLVGVVATAGAEIVSADKSDFGEVLGRWHILFYTSAIMGLGVAIVQKRYWFIALFVLMLAFDMYLQFRLAFGIAMLSVVMLFLNDGRPAQRLAQRWRLVLLVLGIGFALFASKHLIFAMKADQWELVAERLTSPEWYALFLWQSEPFTTQYLLNEVVIQRFHTPWDHIYGTVFQLTLFGPELGISVATFNTYLQTQLFPDIDYGLASNIWAQMWSAGGWTLLIAFLVVFNIGLAIGNAALRVQNSFFRPALIPAFVYWAFYIHRNDLNYIINLEKRMVLVVVAAAILAELAYVAMRFERPGAQGARNHSR